MTKWPMIRASHPKDKNREVKLVGDCGIVAIEAGEGEAPKDATFDMVAYTGRPMNVTFWQHPVLVDLKGLKVSAKSRPVFKDHNSSAIVGHTTEVFKEDGKLLAKGVVSGDNEVAEGIVRAAKKGFPWQASIGAKAEDVVFIQKGATVQANGGTHEGPLYLIRKSRLAEISIVALGADDDTVSRVAANRRDMEVEMEFAKWLEAMGLDVESLTEAQVAKLQAKFDAEQAKPEPKVEAKKEDESASLDLVAEATKQAKYIAEITAAAGGNSEILVKALEGKWTANETKLAKENAELKASRPEGFGVPAQHSKSRSNTDEVLEAAVALQLGVTAEELADPLADASPETRRALSKGAPRKVKPEVIDAALEQYGNIGLRDVCHIFATRDAKYTGLYGDVENMVRASFTTLSLPTVFQEALNRSLLAAYKMSSFNWRAVTKATTVPDFRTQTRFRIHGTGHWEKLSPTGELKHGQIEEGDKYTIAADTIGQMNMLTRQDFINDDLGALSRIASQMAFYGSIAPEIETFKTIIANAGSFFATGNNNLITGAGTEFGLDGLTQLWTKFRNQRDRGVSKDKVKPGIDITPRILLVPVELELEAQLLLGQAKLEVGGSNAATGLVTTNNPFFNKFSIVSSIYLSDTNVHSSASATAYYLMADPSMVPAVEITFLNGRQRPTIESVEPRPEVLGMGFRGWFDFGVKLMDTKGAAKSAGA